MNDRVIVSTEPATGAVLWSGVPGDADREVAAARDAFDDWSGRPLAVRIELLRRFANVVRHKSEAFADLIARETGKPLWEARSEIETVVNKVEISITAYAERTPSKRSEGAMGARTAVRHKPHGVLAVLGPYNFPAHLPNGHIVPALIAGNTVVFKPSEKTPASGAMLAHCFHEAGIPEGAVRLLIGDAREGRALASHPGIDGLLFTGSANGGAALHRQFAETPQRILALEMGGNNPLVVWDTPDIHSAAATIVQSAFLSAGQRCTSARRLIVRDGQHEPLLAEVARITGRLIIDHPHAEPQPFMGPLIDNHAAGHVLEGFLDLMLKGGQPLVHMTRPVPDRPYLTPGIIDVTSIANRSDQEFFGPLLQLVRVPDFEAAIAEANNTRFGLSAALLDQSPDRFDRFWNHVHAGVINWNRPTNGAPSSAPFGGVGLSGNHRPSAYYAADYCAYPVTSSESEQLRATIGVGLRDY